MGKPLSKRKRNSDRFSVARDSWVIRFSAVSDDRSHDHNNLSYYYWQCPDCIPRQHFKKLIVMIIQMYLQRDCETIINLTKQPLSALDLIDQCDTFLKSTNQDINDLEKELIDTDDDNFYLCIDNKQICYLDLLINNNFDCHSELRNVLCGVCDCGRSQQQNIPETTVPVLPPPMPAPLEPSAPHEPVEGGEILVDNTQEHHLSAERQGDNRSNIQDDVTYTTKTACGEPTSVSNELQSLDKSEPCIENSSYVKVEQKCQSTQTDTELGSKDMDNTERNNVVKETSSHTHHLEPIVGQSRSEPVDDSNNSQDSGRKNGKYTYPINSNTFIPLHGLLHSIYKRPRANCGVTVEPERKRHKSM